MGAWFVRFVTERKKQEFTRERNTIMAEKEQADDKGAQGGRGRQNQRAAANQRGNQQRGRQPQVQEEDEYGDEDEGQGEDDSDDDHLSLINKTRIEAQLEPLKSKVGDAFKSQQAELDALQQ